MANAALSRPPNLWKFRPKRPDQPRHESEVVVRVFQPNEIQAPFRDRSKCFRGDRHRRTARNMIDQIRKLSSRREVDEKRNETAAGGRA
jgi:hypothetical protein